MSDHPYTPISCSVYDLLESAAVKSGIIRLKMQRDGDEIEKDIRVLDLFSMDKTEFLKARDVGTGEELTLRLDDIELVTDLETGKSYHPTSCQGSQ